MLERFWTSVSLKPHQGKNWNLAHGKYSSWGMCDFFLMTSLVPSLWRHHCKCRTHLISMKISEGHLGIKWSTEKRIWWRHQSHDSAAILLKKKNLQKSSLRWLNRLRRNFTCMTAYPCDKKVHTYDIIGHMVWWPFSISCNISHLQLAKAITKFFFT